MSRRAGLPKRLPTGTRYVVEGRAAGNGQFRVSARYFLYPDGRRVDVPGETVLSISCCGSKGARCAKDRRAPSRRASRRSSETGLQLGA